MFRKSPTSFQTKFQQYDCCLGPNVNFEYVSKHLNIAFRFIQKRLIVMDYYPFKSPIMSQEVIYHIAIDFQWLVHFTATLLIYIYTRFNENFLWMFSPLQNIVMVYFCYLFNGTILLNRGSWSLLLLKWGEKGKVARFLHRRVLLICQGCSSRRPRWFGNTSLKNNNNNKVICTIS